MLTLRTSAAHSGSCRPEGRLVASSSASRRPRTWLPPAPDAVRGTAGSRSLELTAWSVLGLVSGWAETRDEARSPFQRAHAQDISDTELRVLALEASAPTPMPRACGRRAVDRPAPQLDDLGHPRASFSRAAPSRPRCRSCWASRPVRSGRVLRAARRLERHGGRHPGTPLGGVTGKPIIRGLSYLRRLQGKDGGFALVRGRASDSQSTAWAIQAFVAAGRRRPPRPSAFSPVCAVPTEATAIRSGTRSLRSGSRRRCCRRSRGAVSAEVT